MFILCSRRNVTTIALYKEKLVYTINSDTRSCDVS